MWQQQQQPLLRLACHLMCRGPACHWQETAEGCNSKRGIPT